MTSIFILGFVVHGIAFTSATTSCVDVVRTVFTSPTAVVETDTNSSRHFLLSQFSFNDIIHCLPYLRLQPSSMYRPNITKFHGKGIFCSWPDTVLKSVGLFFSLRVDVHIFPHTRVLGQIAHFYIPRFGFYSQAS